jgi:hypothetical protein
MTSATAVTVSGKLNSVDIEANLKNFLESRKPDERDASFDYCFNYFQSFRESGKIGQLASSSNIEVSCLQLGFYLASWGMYRPNTGLLQKSVRYFVPVIEVIAGSEMSLWEIDAHCYSESNIERLCELADRIRKTHKIPKPREMSDILLTKIILGVFGSVPAFDTNFSLGCKLAGMCGTFGRKALRQIGAFYQANAAVIDAYRVPTLDFVSGKDTERRYTRAKVIDMALYTEKEGK